MEERKIKFRAKNKETEVGIIPLFSGKTATERENIMKSNFKKTKKNKIISLALFFVAFLSIFIQGDATAFVFISLFAIPLFFAKKNYTNL